MGFAPTLSGNDHLRTGDIVTGGEDYHYYGKGNTFGQQRKLRDFVFAPTLSGNDHLRTGNIVGGGRLSLLWQRELVWSAAQARGFRLCSNTVWQRSLTHRQHRGGGEDYHYYGKGNSFGQQRKLGDFVFAPT